MKSSYSTLLSVCALALPLMGMATASARGQAAAWTIADGVSGRPLHSTQGDRKVQVASLTKIATVMVVLDWAERTKQDLNQRVAIPTSVTTLGGMNPAGWQPGDEVSLRDLIYATMLQSDNYAAHTLANYVGRYFRSEKGKTTAEVRFVAQMNALARKLGMLNTRFLNPHGLDNAEKPYSTANDMAKLAAYAMDRSSFRFYVSQRSRKIHRYTVEGPLEYQLVNTNALLGTDGIDGVKTGKTRLAGECLIISSAKAPISVKNHDESHTITPRRLIVVVLNSNDRFNMAEQLLHRGWNLHDAHVAPTASRGQAAGGGNF